MRLWLPNQRASLVLLNRVYLHDLKMPAIEKAIRPRAVRSQVGTMSARTAANPLVILCKQHWPMPSSLIPFSLYLSAELASYYRLILAAHTKFQN